MCYLQIANMHEQVYAFVFDGQMNGAIYVSQFWNVAGSMFPSFLLNTTPT